MSVKQKELVSLFEYLGRPAGIELGTKVYAFAKYCSPKPKTETRYVDNTKYSGKVMMYPTAFLDEYFHLESLAESLKANRNLEFFL